MTTRPELTVAGRETADDVARATGHTRDLPEILAVKGVAKAFGGVSAVDGVDLVLKKGSLSALIGPNGAGKSTLFNLVTGVTDVDVGTICFQGQDVTRASLQETARLGVGRTFQTPCGFASMTVLENLLVVPSDWAEGILGAVVRGRAARRGALARAEGVLKALGLYEIRDTPYMELSGGELRLLEIGRHLMREIELLLLDEPTAGVDPSMQHQLKAVIENLTNSGITVLIVEHNLGFVFDLVSSVAVMVDGRIIYSGSPEEVQQDPDVVAAYLGEQDENDA